VKIPFKYSLRSLFVRRTGTLMTALGIGLAVAIVVVMMAMIRGLDLTFLETGDPLHLVVIRKGSLNEVNSFFGRGLLDTIQFLDGVQRDKDNRPLAAGEIIVIVNHPRKGGDEGNLAIRGTTETGLRLRPEFRIVEGRRFRPGVRELVVSRSLRNRFQGLDPGSTLSLHGEEWPIVGTFEAKGGAYDSEIFAPYEDIAQVWQRPIYSSILLRALSPADAERLIRRISEDQRIQLDAISQPDYYARQTISSVGIKALAFFLAVMLGIGSCFAIMNMMYGAVMSRQQEVATLRALGFRRRAILASFLLESAALGLLGGMMGCLFGALFHGYSAGTSNFSSFSEVVFNFRVTADIIAKGMLFSLVVGILGGFLPAHRAASVRLIDALRE
jgi:putative ABC transport system permease protein